MKNINVKVQLNSGGKATDLNHLASKIEQLPDELGNKFLNDARNTFKESLLNTVHRNLSATGIFGVNSRLYQGIKVTASKAKDSLNLKISVDKKSEAHKYFKVWNYGGTVFATSGDNQFLAVPFADKAPYKSPWQFDDHGDSLFSFVTPRKRSSSTIRLDKRQQVKADVRGTLYFAERLAKKANAKPGEKAPINIVAKFTLVRSLTFKGLHWIENSQKEFIKKEVPKIMKQFDVAKAVTL